MVSKVVIDIAGQEVSAYAEEDGTTVFLFMMLLQGEEERLLSLFHEGEQIVIHYPEGRSLLRNVQKVTWQGQHTIVLQTQPYTLQPSHIPTGAW